MKRIWSFVGLKIKWIQDKQPINFDGLISDDLSLIANSLKRVIRPFQNNLKYIIPKWKLLFTSGKYWRQLPIFPGVDAQLIHLRLSLS